MKKLFLLGVLFLFVSSSFAQEFEVDGINYNITSWKEPYTVKVVRKWPLYDGDIIIPDQVQYDGKIYAVTWIAEGAFDGCSSLTSIVIQNSITSIGDGAFDDCKNLASFEVLVDNIHFASIDGVLYNKEKTTLIICPENKNGQFTIPNSVTTIMAEAFSKCKKITAITIPNSVTNIGDRAFSGCNSLTSIELPNSVMSIGNGAFSECSSLTSIIIPNSVTSIGDYSFYKCSNLITFEVSADNAHFASIDGVLYNKDKTDLIQYPANKKGPFEIQNSVTSIGDRAFSECNNLTSVIIPNSVTSIGDYSFYKCSNITSIDIPNSITSIGDGAFNDCSSLTSIVLPNSATSIGKWLFLDCIRLSSIVLPNSASDIGDYMFGNCNSLTSILIPNSVKSIGSNAFSGCTSLTSITIPNSVTLLCPNAFDDCSNLASIEVSKDNDRYSSIDGVLFNKAKTELIRCPENKRGNYVIPNSVTSIVDSAFSDCIRITKIEISNLVTRISDGAFSGCSSLMSIEIPNSLTSIGSYAFSDCNSLSSIEIPNSVTQIGYHVFSDCTGLTYIVCHSVIPPELEFEIFKGVTKDIPIYVPYNSVHLYQQADQWKEFTILPLPPFIGTRKNLVSGKLYLDANANGNNDNNERGLPQQKLLILPDSVYAQTDNAGNYTFRCDTGSYQIQLVLLDNWQATTATQYDVEVRTVDTSGFDFGMAAIREERRSEVSIASLDGGRCFEPAPVYLTYSNNGTSIENGWLKYYPDSQFGAILKSVPAYDSLSADSSIVYWKMSDVMPFEQRNIMLQMQMPDFRAMGDTLVSALAFEDKASAQYTDTSKMIVRCSYDPNDKQVNPAGVQDEHFVLMSDPLEFTIRFQNTGNDVANRVVILDTLSQHLDLATFAVIASSHSVKTNRNNEGAVEFRFDNIMLADSTTNEPASHGFVKYRIKAKSGLPDSTVVENTSHIFFDYNPAVVTNTTAITMTYKIPKKEVPITEDPTTNVSQSSKSGKAVASIHPNPFSKSALLEFDNPGKDVFELQIANVLGKTQQTIKSTGNLIVIERGNMAEGLYFFTLRNTASGLVYNGNFVVE